VTITTYERFAHGFAAFRAIEIALGIVLGHGDLIMPSTKRGELMRFGTFQRVSDLYIPSRQYLRQGPQFGRILTAFSFPKEYCRYVPTGRRQAG
jgi:hypothetical protein